MECKFCSKLCKNKNSLRNHERLCSGNPNKQTSNLANHKVTCWNRGLTKETDARVAKGALAISATTKGKPSKTVWTPEMKKAKSEWRKQLHKDNPDAHPNRRLAGNRSKMSYPEQVAFDYLTRTGVQFEHQKCVLKYFPDFVLGRVIIEIDGSYWHDKEKDALRDQELKDAGYVVHRINSKERIEERIEEIINGH